MLLCGRRLSFIRNKAIAKKSQLQLGIWGRALVGFLGVKPYKLLVFNVFKAIKWFTMALKILYSWPKKIYQFIHNLFFLTNIPTPGKV